MTMFDDGQDNDLIQNLRAELDAVKRDLAEFTSAGGADTGAGDTTHEGQSSAFWYASLRVARRRITEQADALLDRDASIDALTARVAELMRSDDCWAEANKRLLLGAADDQERIDGLVARVAKLEATLATMPPGWSADLDAMEATTTPAGAVDDATSVDDALIAEIAKAPPRVPLTPVEFAEVDRILSDVPSDAPAGGAATAG